MGWVRIDDGFPEHLKLAAVGANGIAMHLAAICYSNRVRTDGELTEKVARRLVELPRPKYTIDKLVAAGLWEVIPGGYRIHDYLDYQPTRAEIERRTSVKVDAGRKGAEARWGSKGKAKDMAKPMAGAIDLLREEQEQEQLEISTDVDISANVVEQPPTVNEPNRPALVRLDEVWDAVMTVCRIDTTQIPDSERSRYGKVCSQLRRVGATADDIAERGLAYRLAFPQAALTPHALIKHWAEVAGVATQPRIDNNELELRRWADDES